MIAKFLPIFAAGLATANAAGPVRDAIPTNVDGAKYNKPNAGPPGAWFSGASSLPASSIAAAAAKMTKTPKDATYILSNSNPKKATIHSDWAKFSKVSALCIATAKFINL